MAKPVNLPTGASRTSEVGLVYSEVLSNASGTIEVPKLSALRIRAVAGTTVTVDGVLAVTMVANEILTINVGSGNHSDTKETVSVVFSGAVYAQVGKEIM